MAHLPGELVDEYTFKSTSRACNNRDRRVHHWRLR